MCVVQPSAPGFILRIVEFQHEQGISLRSSRSLDKFHTGLFWRSSPFFRIASQASADDVFPGAFASATAGKHMVDAQQLRGEFPTAILADISVPGHYVAPVKMEFLLGQAVEMQQSDDARHLNLEVDRSNPIVVRLFFIRAKLAHFPPCIERIGSELAVVLVNDFGHFAAEQAESPTHVYHVNGHEEPIKHQDAARQPAAGRRGGSRPSRNDGAVSRSMRPRTAYNGGFKPWHSAAPRMALA